MGEPKTQTAAGAADKVVVVAVVASTQVGKLVVVASTQGIYAAVVVVVRTMTVQPKLLGRLEYLLLDVAHPVQ